MNDVKYKKTAAGMKVCDIRSSHCTQKTQAAHWFSASFTYAATLCQQPFMLLLTSNASAVKLEAFESRLGPPTLERGPTSF